MSFWRILVVAVFMWIGMSGIQAASLDGAHPFSELFGVPSWDPSESAVALISEDGTLWVYTGDGRIRAGTWRLDSQEDICLIVGGVSEGCFTTTREGMIIRFKNDEIEWTQEPRPDLPVIFLTDVQRQTYTLMTTSKGSLATDRGGDEHIYIHRDGMINVVQPEGWVKVGSWWFTHDGDMCDNVNGAVECFNIRSVSDEHLRLGFKQDGGDDIELDVRISARSHLPAR